MIHSNAVNICVLIVDDDHYFNANVLGYALERRGFEVLHAYTVKEFEDHWESADVIVLDIRLPDKEGEPIDPWGVLKALKRLQDAHSEATPSQLGRCIIRSAHTQEDSKRAGVPLPTCLKWFGPDAPFSVLLEAVRSATEGGGQP